MPFLSRDELAAWLAEFARVEHPAPISVRVLEQDGSQGGDTGLVAARLSAGVALYMQPKASGDGRWVVTIEARENASEADADEVTRLSAELATAAALCEFLEDKSRRAARP